MINDPLRDVLLPRLEGVKPGAGGYMARCPAHDDGNASLSVAPGRTQPALLTCHAGCSSDDVLDRIGLSWTDLSAPRSAAVRTGGDAWLPCGHTKVAEYEYRDQAGRLIFAVTRCSMKGTCSGFAQWRPDADSKSGKRWSLRLPDGSKVGEGLPYRLPDLLAASAHLNVLVVEGEKDADRAWAMGLPATCNAAGAGKWTQQHAQWLKGRDVVIVADRDKPGRKHALHVAETLTPVARSIDIVQALYGKDLSDHLDGGGTVGTLYCAAEYKKPPELCTAAGCSCEAHL